MPVCPSCHAEYHTGVDSCPDCTVKLVESLPDGTAEAGEGTELVELATFSTVSEAEMVRELMEANGIDAMLRGETDPIGAASGAEPVTILVERQHLDDAKEIYDAFFAGEVEPTGDQPAETD